MTTTLQGITNGTTIADEEEGQAGNDDEGNTSEALAISIIDTNTETVSELTNTTYDRIIFPSENMH